MKKLISMLAIAATLTCVGAMAQPAQNEKQAKSAVQFRQALLQLVRSNVGVLSAMAKGKVPYDAGVMKKNGMRLEQLSSMLEDYFTVDTRGFEVETGALDKIWTNKQDFQQKANALTKASQALQAEAEMGNEKNYKAALGQIFKSCKGCHDSYKAE